MDGYGGFFLVCAGPDTPVEVPMECAPLAYDSFGGIFNPAQSVTGEVTGEFGNEGHENVPLQQHLQSFSGCIVRPVGILSLGRGITGVG